MWFSSSNPRGALVSVTLGSPSQKGVCNSQTPKHRGRKGGSRHRRVPWAGLWEAGSWDKPT